MKISFLKQITDITMDAEDSSQEVRPCELCSTNLAQSFCIVCSLNLCKLCIGEHISDEYDEHNIVPFKQRKGAIIYPKCGLHKNKICKNQCTDCSIFLCCCCMTSKQHKRHQCVNLAEMFIEKKGEIKKKTEELENFILPTAKQTAIEIEHQIANLDEKYAKLKTEISKQRENWLKKLDKIIRKMHVEITKRKAQHLNILQNQLDEINHKKSLIEQTVETLKNIDESNEVSETIAIPRYKYLGKLPPMIQVSMPRFITKPIASDTIINLFGEISPSPLTTAIEKKPVSILKSNTSARERLNQSGYRKKKTPHFFFRYVDELDQLELQRTTRNKE